jgi:hypothetical protein
MEAEIMLPKLFAERAILGEEHNKIAEPVPSEARNLRVCFGYASQPLTLLAMTLRKVFCHCEQSEAISRNYRFSENC